MLLLASLLAATSWAAVDQEIAHLLLFIADSQCVFVRNGSEHEAADAREHIEKKYNYVRRRVKTTEDFIAYAATKSSMTGERYAVICEGLKQPTSQWLQNELDDYRLREAESEQ